VCHNGTPAYSVQNRDSAPYREDSPFKGLDAIGKETGTQLDGNRHADSIDGGHRSLGETEGNIVNSESVPGKTSSLSVSSYSTHSMMAIHYVPPQAACPPEAAWFGAKLISMGLAGINGQALEVGFGSQLRGRSAVIVGTILLLAGLAWMPMQKKKPNRIAGLLAFFPR
jgi:hypothetical protein